MPFIVIFKEERIFCVINRNNKGMLNIISFFFFHFLKNYVLVCTKWGTKPFKGEHIWKHLETE